MNIETVKLDDLKHAANNPRKHDQRNREVVRGSLMEFGQYVPLVVRGSTMEVLIGNCRLDEMRLLGWKECEINKIECTDAQAAAILLVDNRSAELAEWEIDDTLAMLNDLVSQGLNVDAIGWSQADIDAMMPKDEPAPNQDEGSLMAEPIRLTAEQRALFDAAAANIRAREGDPSISEGRIVEFISQNWLEDPNNTMTR